MNVRKAPAFAAPLCVDGPGRIIPLVLAVGAGLSWFAVRIVFMDARPVMLEWSRILNFLLLAPVTEELVFRGIFQPALRARLTWRWGKLTLANILVSTAFALIHLFAWSPAHAAAVFLPSLVFGVLMDCYGMVMYPIAVHALYNLNVFLQ